MTRKRKYSDTQRLEAVLWVIEANESCESVAESLGIHPSLIRQWVHQYERSGEQGLVVRKGSYTGGFKVHVIEYMHENHLSLRQAAVEFGIASHPTVGKWERIYYEEGPQGLYMDRRGRKPQMSTKKPLKMNPDKKVEDDLIAEVQRLRMENEYLKKLQALVQERIDRENGKKPR